MAIDYWSIERAVDKACLVGAALKPVAKITSQSQQPESVAKISAEHDTVRAHDIGDAKRYGQFYAPVKVAFLV